MWSLACATRTCTCASPCWGRSRWRCPWGTHRVSGCTWCALLLGCWVFREIPSPRILSSPGPQPPAAFHVGPKDPSQILVLAKQTLHALRHRPSLLDSLSSQDTRKPPTSAIGRGLHAGADGYGGTVCHAQEGNPHARGRGLARALTPCTCGGLSVLTLPAQEILEDLQHVCRSLNLSLGLRRI